MSRFTPHTSRQASHALSVLLACAALLLIFWALFQLDLPLARYLRSIHQPLLEQMGDVGNRLGSGLVLAAISGSFLIAGWARDRPGLRRVGLEGLLAHAGAALVVNGLKHLIGRPRPRMTHAEGLLAGPSFAGGFDSFPSGHAAASVAVAAVMARHFPRFRWLFYGLAGLVLFSRVVRGSHFPTDVLAGAALGLIAGSLVANPLHAWRASITRALLGLAPFAAGACAVLWVACHPSSDGNAERVLLAAGVLAMVAGWAVRLTGVAKNFRSHGAAGGDGARLRLAPVLIGVGLAATSGSALVVLAALLAGVAWLAAAGEPEPLPQDGTFWMVMAREAALAAGLVGAVAVLRAAQGLLPLL